MELTIFCSVLVASLAYILGKTIDNSKYRIINDVLAAINEDAKNASRGE